ncbi:MAG TPA: sigma-70 family RNA polymerase sigma factor, partial [Planctomycetota bacterium]|nr:sigma-70 family RNA polymerase sigma factor [Planctomycetota bacterium]
VGLPTLRDDEGFAPWLWTIARNRARNARTFQRRHGLLAIPAEPAASASPVDPAEGKEIRATMRALPRSYRVPLVLRLLHGLSCGEIADQLAMTRGSVRVNLCRGLKLLRGRLAADYGP